MADPLTFQTKSGVDASQREKLLGQQGCVVWFTGYSGSGKSTLATALESELIRRGRLAFMLDGDNVRRGLSSDLAFTVPDRMENLRRASEVARLFVDAGLICLVSFISPFRAARERARSIVGPERFFEIHVNTPLEECERRDTKGLYKRARAGEIAFFTGVSMPYEEPEHPDLRIDASKVGVADALQQLMNLLEQRHFVPLANLVKPA